MHSVFPSLPSFPSPAHTQLAGWFSTERFLIYAVQSDSFGMQNRTSCGKLCIKNTVKEKLWQLLSYAKEWYKHIDFTVLKCLHGYLFTHLSMLGKKCIMPFIWSLMLQATIFRMSGGQTEHVLRAGDLS